MFADTRNNDAGSLVGSLTQKNLSHDVGVVIIEVTDRFVCQQEIKRLDERAYQCHALLLSKGHLSYPDIQLVSHAQLFKPIKNLRFGLEMRHVVLNENVLKSG